MKLFRIINKHIIIKKVLYKINRKVNKNIIDTLWEVIFKIYK
jgi:hypothetical protein